MLHITNGDSAAGTLRQAGIPGAVLSWKDVLHEGPVPEGLSLDELRAVRARFIADAGWGAFEDVLNGFARRDEVLESSLAHDEVVLWFEHDLYDQLQLLQVLDWFAGRDLGATRLSLVCGAEYLGSATADRLRERFPSRLPVTPAQRDLARQAWAAFRSPEPTTLAGVLGQDTSALPFLHAAMLRHLQQFPSTGNGLSRSEAQAVEALAAGETRLGKVYVASHHRREEAVFLGDVVFVRYLEGLSRAQQPLLLRADGRPLDGTPASGDARDLWDTELALTEAGRDVLEGRQDHVRLNGIDRWLGGVHLEGREARWRWDESARRLQAAA
jgi:hypothetical protein